MPLPDYVLPAIRALTNAQAAAVLEIFWLKFQSTQDPIDAEVLRRDVISRLMADAIREVML